MYQEFRIDIIDKDTNETDEISMMMDLSDVLYYFEYPHPDTRRLNCTKVKLTNDDQFVLNCAYKDFKKIHQVAIEAHLKQQGWWPRLKRRVGLA